MLIVHSFDQKSYICAENKQIFAKKSGLCLSKAIRGSLLSRTISMATPFQAHRQSHDGVIKMETFSALTGPLCEEFTGHRGITPHKGPVGYAEL